MKSYIMTVSDLDTVSQKLTNAGVTVVERFEQFDILVVETSSAALFNGIDGILTVEEERSFGI